MRRSLLAAALWFCSAGPVLADDLKPSGESEALAYLRDRAASDPADNALYQAVLRLSPEARQARLSAYLPWFRVGSARDRYQMYLQIRDEMRLWEVAPDCVRGRSDAQACAEAGRLAGTIFDRQNRFWQQRLAGLRGTVAEGRRQIAEFRGDDETLRQERTRVDGLERDAKELEQDLQKRTQSRDSIIQRHVERASR